ncbi:MAG: nucleotidyltransferase family protein [Bacilli bacterium]
MVELLRVIKSVIDKDEKKYTITPSLFDEARRNRLLPFLTLVMDENTPPKARRCLFDVYANEIKRNNTQKEALKEIKELFDEANIPYMCPKGFSIKSLYDAEELRFMSDIDILIDKENMEKASSLLLSKGYEQKTKSDHDVGFARKPYIFLEIHHMLISSKDIGGDFVKKSLNNVKFLSPSKEFIFQKREDEFIYLLFHLLKHYVHAGSGVKNYIDMYLYLNRYKEEMDFSYIHQAYKETKYEKECYFIEEVCLNLFDDKYEDFVKTIIGYGTYGTLDSLYEKELKKSGGSKVKWLFTRAFPSFSSMKPMYPVLEKKGGFLLLPFCYLHRFGRLVTKDRKFAKKRLSYMKKKNTSENDF